MKLQVLVLTTLLVLGSMATMAQTDSLKKVQKIEELLQVLNMEQECNKAALTSAEQTMTNAPQLAAKKEATRAFFTKYMGFAAIKPELIRIYSKYYTADEIADLTKFYKTSAGKKFNTVAGNIAAESVQAYTESLQKHADELKQIAESN